MVFASVTFLTFFLPLAIIPCFLIRSTRFQNLYLALVSLLFYAWGEPVYILLLLASILVNDILARAIAKGAHKKLLTSMAVVFNIGLLFVFKYGNFCLNLFNLGEIAKIVQPIGISFYTFQILSYVLDVSAGRAEPERSRLNLLLYISSFPQLIAGPIVTWNEIRPQLNARRITLHGAAQGLCIFILGLAQKVLLADSVAPIADAAFAASLPGLPLAWLGAIAYTLQLYLDFSGYSIMAIGLGRMLGFTFPENFRTPLCAWSIQNFWRRWHITLTGWFRQYLYFPLGGNRKGTFRTYRNLIIVFLLTGFWHGAAWTFVVWGIWHGVFMLLERAKLIRPERMPRILAHAYTLLVVILGFVIFRAESLGHTVSYFTQLFAGEFSVAPFLAQLSPFRICMLILSALTAAGIFNRFKMLPEWMLYVVCAILTALCYISLIAQGYHPFLYFRF